MPRPEAFIALTGSAFVARRAGTAPKITQVNAATEAAKHSTRQSVAMDRSTELLAVESDQTSTRLKSCARLTPSAAPIPARRMLSTSNCRSRRAREAPNARRTAISRSRVLACASIRLARLAHAISSTKPVMASSHSDESYCLRSALTPAEAGNAPSRNRL